MSTSFEARIPGKTRYLPLAVRLVRELGALPEGPGEEEVEPLMPPVEKLLERLLEALEKDGRDLEARLAPAGNAFVLSLRVAAGNVLLDADDPALTGLDAVFDRVQVDQHPDGSLEITVKSDLDA